jgi:hypothetical protein
MLRKDYERKGSVAKEKAKTMVMSLKVFEAKTNLLAANCPP